MDILAGMGAYAREWSSGADSFTVNAYGSAEDVSSGGGWNRGQIFWNNGGPITVTICTEYMDIGGGDVCSGQDEYTVASE